MQSFKLGLRLLLTVSLTGILAKQAAAVTVDTQLFTAASPASGCTPPVAKSRFILTDTSVTYWVRTTGGNSNDFATLTWHSPSGKVFEGKRQFISGSSDCKSWTADVSSMEKETGLWKVDLNYNLDLLATLTFDLSTSPNSGKAVPENQMLTRSAPDATAGCEVPAPVSQASMTDPSIDVWFKLRDLKPSDTVSVEWISAFGEGLGPVKLARAANQNCFTHRLEIAKNSSSTSGNWAVRATVNGNVVFTQPFEIHDPSRELAAKVVKRFMSSLEDCGTAEPAPVDVFSVNDAHASVYFVVENVGAGDTVGVQFFRPDGQYFNTVDFEPITEGGKFCAAATLPIAGSSPSNLPGEWKARLIWNRSQLATMPVPISATAGSRIVSTGAASDPVHME